MDAEKRSFSMFNDILKDDALKHYALWKSHRLDMISKLGPILLSHKESERSQIFTAIEQKIKELIDAQRRKEHLFALLLISIHHFFKRSSDKVKCWFPFLMELLESKDQDMCRISMLCLRYLAEENPDNRRFLKDTLDMAKHYLSSPGQDKRYVYNALCILRVVGIFMPEDVCGVIWKHFSEIWYAVCSSLAEWRLMAVKVINIHLMSMSRSNVMQVDLMAESFLSYCATAISSETNDCLHGPLLVYRSLFALCPDSFHGKRTQKLLKKLIDVAKVASRDLLVDLYQFIIEIANAKPKVFRQMSGCDLYIVTCISHIMAGIGIPELLIELKSLMKCFVSHNICEFPARSIIGMAECCVSKSMFREYTDHVFDVLSTVLELFPSLDISIDIFKDAKPSKHYFLAIKTRPVHILELREHLIEQFNRGVQPQASVDDQIVSILLVQQLEKLCFEKLLLDPEVLFEKMLPFTFSPVKEIRHLIAETLPVFCSIPIEGAVTELIGLAVMDPDESIRKTACLSLRPEDLVRDDDAVEALLVDPVYEIRQIVIPLIARAAQLHPVNTKPFITVFCSEYFSSNMHFGDPSKAAVTCSLFPMIAQYFVQEIMQLQLIPVMIWSCLWILSHGDPIVDIDTSYDLAGIEPLDIRLACHRDFTTVPSVDAQMKEKNIEKTRIYQIVNEKWLETCDRYMLDTLGQLAKYITPFLLQVIPVFITILKSKHSKDVYLSALKALRSIVLACNANVNFIDIFPDLLPTLLALLANNAVDEQVSVKILKLTGTIGLTKSTLHETPIVGKLWESFFAVNNPSYFTSSVMNMLVDMLKYPSTNVFEAITCIFVEDTTNALQFLQPVVEAFAVSIEHDPSDIMFNRLERIVESVEYDIIQILPVLREILIKQFETVGCIRLAHVLSYHLRREFREIACVLYPMAIKMLNDVDKALAPLLQFTVSVIVFQSQSAEMFVECAESRLQTERVDGVTVSEFVKALATLVQSHFKELPRYTARLVRIGFMVLDRSRHPDAMQLLYSLVLVGRLSIEVLERNAHMRNIIMPELGAIKRNMENGLISLKDSQFIKHYSIKPSSSHLKNVSPQSNDIKNPFTDIECPQCNEVQQWLDDLVMVTTSNSPYVVIRSCSSVVEESLSFRRELLPLAFYSCWKGAESSEKEKFSEIVKKILVFPDVEPLIELIEMLDRAGDPLPNITDDVIARACKSPALSMYYFQRHLRSNRGNEDTIQRILELSSMMGSVSSARGLLKSATQINRGKWNEELGEWEKALDIYEKSGDSKVSDLLRCYVHLEQWDKVRSLSSDQVQDALWFAWAEFHAQNTSKVNEYRKKADKNDIEFILFNIIFLTSCEKYDKAKNEVERGFKALVDSRSAIDGSNRSKSSKMAYAQHLIELKEVINIKSKNLAEIPEIWQNRINNFSHESEAWMKFIEIRSLIIDPADHCEYYMKILSVLRKERKWKLIDVYWDRFFSNSTSVDVMLAKLKTMWDRNQKPKAMAMLSYLNKILRSSTLENFTEVYNSVSESHRNEIWNALGMKNDEASITERFDYIGQYKQKNRLKRKMMPRLLRIQASWQYSLYTSKTSPVTSLLQISKLFDESLAMVSNDYRTWAGYAYANSRALSHFPDLRANCALNAISGFLRATQLHPVASLEFMCQMFAILFKYGDVVELTRALRADIISLPASIINQVIPQIVCCISEKNNNVRQLVLDVLNVFGVEHFQALVFPLHVLSLLTDKAKSSSAQNLMKSLVSKHPEISADAGLLIDGLRRGAVCWEEYWIRALDTASRAQQLNDRNAVIQIIDSLYARIDKPICKQDLLFIETFGESVQKCRISFEQYKSGDNSVAKSMWEDFRALFHELDDRIKKTDVIQLRNVSENLANKRRFALSIPGTYSVDAPSPQLDAIDPCLRVLNTQQHPRIVFMADTEGTRYKFLLKGNEDIRLDQRVMQLFMLINSLLKTNRNTARLGASIMSYSIIPFAPNAGLITWVTGADTFHQLVSDFRSHRNIRPMLELDICNQIVGDNFNTLSALQRYEVFGSVSETCHANDLMEMLRLRSPDPSSWLARSQNFTVSTALMSIAGYVIGLGDRHPSNIMVQRHTGRVIHIDFGDSFEVAMNRQAFAERVPFRLTRMIVNALDGSSVDGLFRDVCEDVLWVLREHHASIIAQLEVFIHEPIFDRRNLTNKPKNGILERVACKLSGEDTPQDRPRNVSEQVDMLISIASDPREYVRHYIGWCPFW